MSAVCYRDSTCTGTAARSALVRAGVGLGGLLRYAPVGRRHLAPIPALRTLELGVFRSQARACLPERTCDCVVRAHAAWLEGRRR